MSIHLGFKRRWVWIKKPFVHDAFRSRLRSLFFG
jgi:hypothetical protein